MIHSCDWFTAQDTPLLLRVPVPVSIPRKGSRCYLAALAGEQAVVVSRHFVSTHRTQLFQVIVVCVFHNLQSHTWSKYTHTHTRDNDNVTQSEQCKYHMQNFSSIISEDKWMNWGSAACKNLNEALQQSFIQLNRVSNSWDDFKWRRFVIFNGAWNAGKDGYNYHITKKITIMSVFFWNFSYSSICLYFNAVRFNGGGLKFAVVFYFILFYLTLFDLIWFYFILS